MTASSNWYHYLRYVPLCSREMY